MAFKKTDKTETATKSATSKEEIRDFSKVVGDLPSREFAIKMHERLVRETEIVENKEHGFDVADINRILARYPQYFSWAIVEAELIREAHANARTEYDEWHNAKFKEYSANTAKGTTIKAIEADMQTGIGPEMAERKQALNELDTKLAIANGMVKVWAAAIGSLQSLSKNIAAEMAVINRSGGV